MHLNFKNPLGIFLLAVISLSMSFKPASSQRIIRQDQKLFQGYSDEMLWAADSLYENQRFGDAAGEYLKSYRYFNANQNWKGIVYSAYMLAEINNNFLYDSKKSLAYIKISYKEIQDHRLKDDILLADFYLINGTVLSSIRQDSALQLMDLALNIYKEKFGLNSMQAAECYFYKGQTLIHNQSEFDEAYRNFKLSMAINKNYFSDQHVRLTRMYYYYGSYFRNINDYHNAIIYAERTLDILLQDTLLNSGFIGTLYGYLANYYNELLEDSLAIFYYHKAISRYLRYYGNVDDLCGFYLNLGVKYLNNNHVEKAQQYISASLNNFRKYRLTNKSALADIYCGMGRYNTKIRNFDSARYYFNKSIGLITHELNDRNRLADRLEFLGEMFNTMGNYDSAIYYYQQALISIDAGFKSNAYFINPPLDSLKHRLILYNILSGEADVYMNMYYNRGREIQDLFQALNIFELLDLLNDQMRNSDLQEESQLILATFFQQGNERAIECSQELYQITRDPLYFEQTLKFMEKNKYMQLFKALMVAESKDKINVPKMYREYYDSLKLKMAFLDQAMEKEKQVLPVNVQKLNALSSQRVMVIEKQAEFKTDMSQKYPNYFQVHFDSLSASYADILNAVKKNERLLIEYYYGKDNIYIIAISAAKKSIHKIRNTGDLALNIREYISLVSEHSEAETSADDFKRFCLHSMSVFKYLLEPVLTEHGYNESGDLLIIPDGILAQVPFEALIKEAPQKMNSNYASLHYIINDHLVSYAYSVNLFMRKMRSQEKAPNNLLAFSYSGYDVLADAAKRTSPGQELPGTAMEIASIKKVVKGYCRFFENEQATEHNFKLNAPLYRILHLGVHGQADMNSPLNSKLLFKGASDSADDGNLYVYELYGMDLSRSELAVLSACETGIGKEFHGEGVFSVARGFAYAGCPSIIMSLWRVDDIQSAKIMTEFYKIYMKGNHTARALRESKLKYINSSQGLQAQPSNWAAFVILGNNVSYNFVSMYEVIISGFIVLITLILLFLFRKKLAGFFRKPK